MRRRLQWEFGDDLQITYVMTGLARTIDKPIEQLASWLDAAARSQMPVDPRLWLDAPPSSTYPACLAVKAADEQALGEPYLRELREGFAIHRRKLDTTDALVQAARAIAGMDVERFKIDLGSHAIVEAFGTDLDRATTAEGQRIAGPWLEFSNGQQGVVGGVGLDDGIDGWRKAAVAAGAVAGDHMPPSIEQALRSLGPLATPEVAAVCELPGPRAAAELWALAVAWTVRAEQTFGGVMWSVA